MSLALYLDDCALSRELKRLLVEAGHNVQTPDDVKPSLAGEDDAVHFAHVKMAGRVILTYNSKDFKALHDADPNHAGILAIYQDNDPTRDMTYRQIVQAIGNLESMGVPIAGEFWSINAYRW